MNDMSEAALFEYYQHHLPVHGLTCLYHSGMLMKPWVLDDEGRIMAIKCGVEGCNWQQDGDHPAVDSAVEYARHEVMRIRYLNNMPD